MSVGVKLTYKFSFNNDRLLGRKPDPEGRVNFKFFLITTLTLVFINKGENNASI